MAVSQGVLDQIALSRDEYDLIVERLGREPNPVELGMLGSLWSEHCSYKHSRPLLRQFPSTGERVVVGPGVENAGVVDIGDGLSVVMKIESHNHPSAIEPHEGAATGVGGIVRDIFTMGARPVALLNSLRFGPLDRERNRYLFGGVVGGIADYGNCIGVPNVGGEVFFSESYSGNPLVNAMCVGLVETERLVRARAEGAGNLVVMIGADTGRDGIHGASGLASRTFEEERELRPTVQVGNPFLEKVLIEACLELARMEGIVGIADLGAAGLTSAAIESAGRAGSGIELDVALVARREEGMTPYEVMLSESQERMLIIVRPEEESALRKVTDRWDLRADVIGRVTDDRTARIWNGETQEADLPMDLLIDAPQYRLQGVKPPEMDARQRLDNLPLPSVSPNDVLLRLLRSPNIASKLSVYRQYDHQVQTNTVIPPGSDAAVLRIKGTSKGMALTTDGNGRYCYLDPYVGGAIAVAEAARNVTCVGAKPIAVTDCLNFGNPEKPEVYYRMEECIRGMADVCRELGVPVISGNVSLYNETGGQPVYPTPVVGMLGLLEEIDRACDLGFRDAGDAVLLLGNQEGESGLGGSEYLEVVHRKIAGKPVLDLALEKRVQECCLRLINEGMVRSAHDCSLGGLAVALALCSIKGGLGFQGRVDGGTRWDALLFGEVQSRIVVSVKPDQVVEVLKVAGEADVPVKDLGVVGGDRFVIDRWLDLPLDEVEMAWATGLDNALK